MPHIEQKSAYVIRLDGPMALTWEGVGQRSIGRSDLPLNQPFLIREIQVRHPAHDSNAHMRNAGSKTETFNLQARSVADILRDIKLEYPSFEWHCFDSLDEARSFLETGKSDLVLFDLPANYTADDLKRSYRSLSLSNHPDLTHGSGEAMQIITAAHRRLQEKLNNA